MGEPACDVNMHTVYDDRTHVYMKPDMYVGDSSQIPRDEVILNLESMHMEERRINFPRACERLFLEILSNASDNIHRSRMVNVDPGCIDIKMNGNMITVTNYGCGIPIVIHHSYNIYVPEMIFSTLYSIYSYVSIESMASNGLGAKVVNIFSSKFRVIIYDHINHLKYTQTWNDNMKIRQDPIIEPYQGEISSVQVRYRMDFNRFGLEEGYSSDIFGLFARHAADVSFTKKTTILFNCQEINAANIKDYAKLCLNKSEGIVRQQWVSNDNNIENLPELEFIVVHTPNQAKRISFVNGIRTSNGGVHMDAVLRKIHRSLSYTYDKKYLNSHISVIVSYNPKCPRFSNQCKDRLVSPTPNINNLCNCVVEQLSLVPHDH